METRERRRRLVSTERITTIQADENGEIKSETNEVSFKSISQDIEPDFVKLYLNDIARLYDLPRATSKLLLEILRFMGYDNVVALGKWRKAEIANKLGISTGTLANALTKFIEEGILSKVSSSEFVVNPMIFGRGKWKDIHRLRILIEYSPDGKQFSMTRE